MIKTVFLDLSENKRAENITVREICESARINRSSFYLHFVDIYELIEEINRDMLNRIEGILAQAMTDSSITMKQVFTELFRFLQENQSFLVSYYKSSRVSLRDLDLTKNEQFASRIMAAGKNMGFSDEKEIRYHYLFFAAGLSVIIEEWLLGGCAETPEDLACLIYREYRRN